MFHDANSNQYHLGTNTPNGYGCMIGSSESTTSPRCGSNGETTPTPTKPIFSPTITPIVQNSPEPAIYEREQPTLEPTVWQIFSTSVLSSPTKPNNFPPQPIFTSTPQSFKLPTPVLPVSNFSKIKADFTSIKQTINQSVNLLKYIFTRLVYYDRQLENAINGEIEKIISNFQ